MLCWEFDRQGEWEAASRYHDDGSPFSYRIQVCGDGTFDVSKSDFELIGKRRVTTFDSLRDAKRYCQENESK